MLQKSKLNFCVFEKEHFSFPFFIIDLNLVSESESFKNVQTGISQCHTYIQENSIMLMCARCNDSINSPTQRTLLKMMH